MTEVAFPFLSTPFINGEAYREGDCRTAASLLPPPISKIVDLPTPPAPQKLLVPTVRNEHSLHLSTTLETSQLACGSVHKLWGNVTLGAVNRKVYTDVLSTMDIDFVVVIDHSSSMRLSSKLAYVKATIEYFIKQLNQAHRFCLVKFNHEVKCVTDGLIQMTPDSKDRLLDLLHSDIRAEGSTNISDALFTALGILKRRHESEHGRLSCIMLFTDGLANAGLRGKQFMESVHGMAMPQNLVIHTFGYGVDHDSRMLQDISFCSKGGCYHFIETNDSIPATFGECLAGLLSTVAHNIQVKLTGRDGCRLVNFYTKYPIAEVTPVKEYCVSLGSLYSQESRSVLFKLSLRKFPEPLDVQPLVDVAVSYTNTLTGRDMTLTATLSMSRPVVAVPTVMPVPLDMHINRYMAAAAIDEAIVKASCRDFIGAQRHITDAIENIKKSVSFQKDEQLVRDLIEDLQECAFGMATAEHFSCGVHYAHSYAGMYFLERSTGSANLVGVAELLRREQLTRDTQPAGSPTDAGDLMFVEEAAQRRRHCGYGYVTYDQEALSMEAVKEAKFYVAGYLEGVL